MVGAMSRAFREAVPFLAPIVVGWPLLAGRSPWRHAAFGLATGAVLAFFRDPERNIPVDEGIMVSAADGRVTDIARCPEPELAGEDRFRISVFLSIFDVHVNRAPIAGKVVASSETPGKFLDARNPLSATQNTARTWGIESPDGLTVVRQISGAVARRIRPWAQVGHELAMGERFGMIRFGSRTDVFLPPGYFPTVEAGDIVRGGVSVIAAREGGPA